ncbi:ABC transporter permease [Beduini massiliensis]|uniref:ABC transporter permease n=2 Tax=Beduini massiliensis TaxID=1585974 RepID=UPI00059AA38B|nr:FtsX-like permease family protein [Beduini massiliensis]
MSMMKLAVHNFKTSFKSYLSLIISLAFTILIFYNFQNILFSGVLTSLGESNTRNIRIIIQVITLVLICFILFFVWYSTNVFLTKRKKEIGIYVFMGLTNQKIGKLYMIETTLIGLVALGLGIGFGVLTTQLFQMIMMAISDISVELVFGFSLQAILLAAVVYLVIYFIFTLKGYVNIVRSSVLEMVSANKQNEYVKTKAWILILKSILGVIITGIGYYLAIKEGGIEVMSNVLSAVVFVIIGVYLLFGGLIPLICQKLADQKRFLYKRERNLWINNIIFRIKKNYHTYAMVSVLMLCSVTALATGFAMKNRYEGIVHFRNTYTFQILSSQTGLREEYKRVIEKESGIAYSSKIALLQLDSNAVDSPYQNQYYGILSYSQVQQLAKESGLDFPFEQLEEDEYISVSQLHLMSFITDSSLVTETINGKVYQEVEETSIPYLGYLQEKLNLYMVSDSQYQELMPLGTVVYCYNYKLSDMDHFEAAQDILKSYDNYDGLVSLDPNSNEIEWIKVLYSLCVFMFMVFVLASGSILFMKLYNDAYDEKERYQILHKIGISKKTLKKAIINELRFAYLTPLLVMSISSYFSVHSLAKLMQTKLLNVNIMSVLVIYVFIYICYRLSVSIYQKNVGIK